MTGKTMCDALSAKPSAKRIAPVFCRVDNK
jgi:hypothetical protein